MGCGCNKGNARNRTPAAAPVTAASPTLYESVNAGGGVVYRSRVEATARVEGAKRGGVRVRPAGTP